MARRAGTKGSDTKEHIVLTALKLFSERGYNGVSVRSLTREVGIKESSLYNHFPSKDAIIEEIYSRFRNRLLSREVTPEAVDALLDSIPPDEYFTQVFQNFAEGMTDPFAVMVWRILIAEQFRDPRAYALYNTDISDKLRTDTILVLSRMQVRNLLKDIDLETAAVSLLEGIKGMLFRFIGNPERGKDEFIQSVYNHIGFFYTCIRRQ